MLLPAEEIPEGGGIKAEWRNAAVIQHVPKTSPETGTAQHSDLVQVRPRSSQHSIW